MSSRLSWLVAHFQTVYEGESWCLCIVTFGQNGPTLNSRPVYCLHAPNFTAVAKSRNSNRKRYLDQVFISLLFHYSSQFLVTFTFWLWPSFIIWFGADFSRKKKRGKHLCIFFKGQGISEAIFLGFNLPQKQRSFFHKFCPK